MNRSEIWDLDLNPTRGSEIHGKPLRPCVIVSDNAMGRLPLKIIVPITEWQENFKTFPWMVKVESCRENGLTKTSAIDCFQIRSVDEQRLKTHRGYVKEETLRAVIKAVNVVLGNY